MQPLRPGSQLSRRAYYIAAECLVETVDKLLNDVYHRSHPDDRFGWRCLGPFDAPVVDKDLIPHDGFVPSLAHGFRQQPAFVPILLGTPVRDSP